MHSVTPRRLLSHTCSRSVCSCSVVWQLHWLEPKTKVINCHLNPVCVHMCVRAVQRCRIPCAPTWLSTNVWNTHGNFIIQRRKLCATRSANSHTTIATSAVLCSCCCMQWCDAMAKTTTAATSVWELSRVEWSAFKHRLCFQYIVCELLFRSSFSSFEEDEPDWRRDDCYYDYYSHCYYHMQRIVMLTCTCIQLYWSTIQKISKVPAATRWRQFLMVRSMCVSSHPSPHATSCRDGVCVRHCAMLDSERERAKIEFIEHAPAQNIYQ